MEMSRTLENHLDPDAGPKRILALDGGGVKGILTLGMLEVLETELRRRANNPNLVLSDYFDLIGGTSTGAIMATGLALGLTVRKMIDLYLDLGPKVFGKQKAGGYLDSKYDNKALRSALWPVFDKKTLGSQSIRTGLALHAKRIDTGSPWVLTNNPRARYFDPGNQPQEAPNKDFRLIDIVMASAAAPTFFDEVRIPMRYNDKDKPVDFGYFVDGAVGGFNNPSIQLLLTVLVPAYGFAWRSGEKNLMMASFGTGSRRPQIEGRKFSGKPSAFRGISALRSMIFDTQMLGITLLQSVSESLRPWTINSEVGDLAGVCITPERLLDFQRVDVMLEEKRKPKRGEKLARTKIEELLNQELDAHVLESVDQLANGHPDNMALLLAIGRKAAPAYIDTSWPLAKFDLPEWQPIAAG
jgi:uncharacterized protein